MRKEYDFSKLKELKNPYPRKKKAVGINLSSEVVDYFKGLAEETGLPYQKLIDLYLLDCARKRKKLAMKWVAERDTGNQITEVPTPRVAPAVDLMEALKKSLAVAVAAPPKKARKKLAS
jgi:hypothetical protein